MTSGDSEPAAPHQALEQAVAELDRLRQVLELVGRGEAGATAAQQAVTDYVRDNGEALTTAASAVGEQVRSELLAQLYGWRAQVQRAQLGADPASRGRASP